MSSEPANHAMWVHYADEHRGFVIGFRTYAGFLTRAGSRLEIVRYEAMPSGLPVESMDRCFYKDVEWKYEREWRCIRKISAELQRSDTFAPEDIAEIIIGTRMADSDINAILQFIEAVNGSDADSDEPHAQIRVKTVMPERGTNTVRVFPSKSHCSAVHSFGDG